MLMSTPNNTTCAVVMAHPDDAEIGCMGAMLLLKERGWDVHLLIVGSGEHGISVTDRADLSEVFEQTLRLRESRASFEDTGVHLECLLQQDGSLTCNIALISAIEKVLRRVQPSLLITHHIDETGIDHQDHSAVARATMNASIRTASIQTILHCEPHLSRTSFLPNVFVDITPHMERKLTALACHESQAGRVYLSRTFHLNRGLRNAHKAATRFLTEERYFEAFSLALHQVL